MSCYLGLFLIYYKYINKKVVTDVKILSSYAIKLNGDFKSLETSIELYRKFLRMLIPIINDRWTFISECLYIN